MYIVLQRNYCLCWTGSKLKTETRDPVAYFFLFCKKLREMPHLCIKSFTVIISCMRYIKVDHRQTSVSGYCFICCEVYI